MLPFDEKNVDSPDLTEQDLVGAEISFSETHYVDRVKVRIGTPCECGAAFAITGHAQKRLGAHVYDQLRYQCAAGHSYVAFIQMDWLQQSI